MNCPHCQRALPEKYAATYCPQCGGALPPENPVPPLTEPLKPFKIKWPIFFLFLLGPPVLTLLTSFLTNRQVNAGLPTLIGLLGGVAGGITCGVMLALRLGKNVGAQFLLGLLFSSIFIVVCVMLSLCGCMVGGYKMTF